MWALAGVQEAGAGWLVSPNELREALSGIDNGMEAKQFELAEMHDASEVRCCRKWKTEEIGSLT